MLPVSPVASDTGVSVSRWRCLRSTRKMWSISLPTVGNLPPDWIDASMADQAEEQGYTVVGPDSVLITHLAETIKANLSYLLTYGALQRLVSEVDAWQGRPS